MKLTRRSMWKPFAAVLGCVVAAPTIAKAAVEPKAAEMQPSMGSEGMFLVSNGADRDPVWQDSRCSCRGFEHTHRFSGDYCQKCGALL